MRISVCTDALYASVDTVTAMEAVHMLDFRAIEFWSWENKDIDAIDRARKMLGMEVTTFCTSFVSLTDPAELGRYLDGLERSIAVAKRLDCKRLITQVGQTHSEVAGEDYKQILTGLRACLPLLEKHDITLLIEPLNTRVDHLGYYLESSNEGYQLIDDVGSPHVRLLFDIYHQQITEGDVIRRLSAGIDRIGHFHAAGNPGRNELDNGELNYDAVFRTLDSLGYDGFVGLEYFPLEHASEGLLRLHEAGRRG